jgi:hypothetical protein
MEEPVKQPTADPGAESDRGAGRPASTPLVVGGYFTALILAPVGLIIGVFLLFRRRGHGIAVIAIALSVIAISLFAASRSNEEAPQIPQQVQREAHELTNCVTKAPIRISPSAQLRICEKQLHQR